MFSLPAAPAGAVGNLSVILEIVEGAGLAGKDKSGKSDPYCKILFRNGKKKLTKTIPQNNNPIWKEQFNLGPFVPEDVVEVTCWDRDVGTTNDVLGYFLIKLGDFMKKGEHTKTYALESRPGKQDKDIKGKITVKLFISETAPAPVPVSASLPVLTKKDPLKKKEDKEEESTDRAFVRRKLTGWLKLRPDKDKMEDKLRLMGVLSGDACGKMFGASLDEVMTRQRRQHPDVAVPIFIHQLIEKLLNDRSTFEEAGLFRISGSAAVVSKIKGMADAGQDPDLSQISRDDAASLLKEFMRQLPEPLFTWKLADDWKAAGDTEDESLLLPKLKALIHKLPGHNKQLWYAVNSFLHKLSLQSDVNKMTPENIGIVIGPNVLWDRDTHFPIMNMNFVVSSLIRHYDTIYADWEMLSRSAEGIPLSPSRSLLTNKCLSSEVIRAYVKPAKPIQDWTVTDVTDWLADRGYSQYADVFTKTNIDGKALLKLTPDQLLADCQIKSLGHRKKIIFRRDDLVQT